MERKYLPKKQQILNNLSELVARASFANKLGMSFEGKRDLYLTLGYKTSLSYEDFELAYSRNAVASAVIERPVKVTWTGPLNLIESTDKEETEFEKAWKDLEKRLKLKSKFIRLDKLTGLGKYGVLLLGFDDIETPDNWLEPVSAPRKLLYVKPLGQLSARIATYCSDSGDERYGMPETYDITIKEPSIGGASTSSSSTVATSTLHVHYSRVLHIVEGAMENDIEGTSRLQVVYNPLQDIEKVAGGSAEMYWKGARPGYASKVDKDFSLSPTDEADMLEQYDEYEHGLRRFLTVRGMTIDPLDVQVSSPKDAMDAQFQLISAQTGIPKRILSGSERGELSSSQDANEWKSFCKNRRDEFAEPEIVRPFVDKMIELGVLPKPKQDYSIEWQDLYSQSEDEQVSIGAKRATALRDYFANPQASEVVVPRAFYSYFLGFNEEQVELMMEMEGDEVLRSIRDQEEQESIHAEAVQQAKTELQQQQIQQPQPVRRLRSVPVQE